MLPFGLATAGSVVAVDGVDPRVGLPRPFGSVVGYTAYSWLLHHAPLGTVSTYAYVNPVVAIILGVLFRDESADAADPRRRRDRRRLGRGRRAPGAAGRDAAGGGCSLATARSACRLAGHARFRRFGSDPHPGWGAEPRRPRNRRYRPRAHGTVTRVTRFWNFRRAVGAKPVWCALGHNPTMSSGRTGTRRSSRPVAARSAEATAAVATTVGGSPIPFTP